MINKVFLLMLFTRKLISLLLLGLFQVFVIHQALPHEHHTHHKSNSEEVISQSLHTHIESHHHHNDTHTQNHHHYSEQQIKSHSGGLLGLILGNHSHSHGANHVPVVKTPAPQNFKIKDLGKSLFAIATTTSSSLVASSRSSQAVYEAADIQYHQYHPFISLRGPPKYI